MRSISADCASVMANSARSSGESHHFPLALALASAAFGSILSALSFRLSVDGPWLSNTGSRQASASSAGTCPARAEPGTAVAQAKPRSSDDRRRTCILKGLRSTDRACLPWGGGQLGEPLHDPADDGVGRR